MNIYGRFSKCFMSGFFPLLLLCFSYYRVLSLRLTLFHFYNNSVYTHTCEYLQHMKYNKCLGYASSVLSVLGGKTWPTGTPAPPLAAWRSHAEPSRDTIIINDIGQKIFTYSVTKWINWVRPNCFHLDGHDGLQKWRQIFTAPPSKSEDLAWGLAVTSNHLAEVTLCSFPAYLWETWFLFLLCL